MATSWVPEEQSRARCSAKNWGAEEVMNLERGGWLERAEANFFAGNTLKGNESASFGLLLIKPTRAELYRVPGERGETPKEEKAHEGTGQRPLLTRRRW